MSAAAPVSAAVPSHVHGGEVRHFNSEATRQLIAAFEGDNASLYQDALRALEALADPDARNERGRPLFFRAIESLEVPFVMAFLRAGANPNIIYTPSRGAGSSEGVEGDPAAEVYPTSPSIDPKRHSKDIVRSVFCDEVLRDEVFQKREADKFMAVYLCLKAYGYDINRPFFLWDGRWLTTFDTMVYFAGKLRDTTKSLPFFKELVTHGAKIDTEFLTRWHNHNLEAFVKRFFEVQLEREVPEKRDELRARQASRRETQIAMFGRVQQFIREVGGAPSAGAGGSS